MKLPSLKRRGRAEAMATAGAPLVTRRPYRQDLRKSDRTRRRLLLLFVLAAVMAAYGFLFAWLPPAFLMPLLAPIAVLALVVVWALPDTERPPLRSMEWVFGCYFASVILWPYYLAIQIPGLPLLELRRVFASVALLLFLVSLSTSAAFRKEMADIMRANSIFMKILIAFVCVQAISIIFAAKHVQGVITFVKNQLSWTAVFFIAVYLFSQPGRIKRWVWSFVGFALILSVVGYFEYRNQGILWADHIPSFLRVNDPAMVNLLEAVFRDGKYRVVTTFSVSLALAEFMALVMPFLIHGVMTAKAPWVRVACALADLMIFGTIILTQARVGIVGALVAHAVYGLVWALRRWRTDKTSLIGPAATLAYPMVFALLGVAILTVGRLRTATLGGGQHAASTTGRLEQAEASGPVLMRSPLFGHGPRQGVSALGYTNPAGEVSIDSYILAMLLDYGVIGFTLYYAMFIYMFVQALRVGSRARNQELAYVMGAGVAMMVWLASRLVLAQEDNNSITYMLLALIAAVVYLTKRADADEAAKDTGEPQLVRRSR